MTAAFHDSSDAVADADELRRRFDRDGYLFLPGLLDGPLPARLHDEITDILVSSGWVEDASLRPLRPAAIEGEEDHWGVVEQIQRLLTFNQMPHLDQVKPVMSALLGEKYFPHPLGIVRLSFPDAVQWSTPAHQDYPNNQGTERLFAMWTPLHDCPVERGPLEVLEGSHALGLLPVGPALGAGLVTAVGDERHEQLRWVGGDIARGDVLVFHSLTVHRARPNVTNALRLSVDYRFQADGDALTEACLEPHFGRQSWETIYADWPQNDLHYYWRNHSYRMVPKRPIAQSTRPTEHDNFAAFHAFNLHRRQLCADKNWECPAEIERLVTGMQQAVAGSRQTNTP